MADGVGASISLLLGAGDSDINTMTSTIYRIYAIDGTILLLYGPTWSILGAIARTAPALGFLESGGSAVFLAAW